MNCIEIKLHLIISMIHIKVTTPFSLKVLDLYLDFGTYVLPCSDYLYIPFP